MESRTRLTVGGMATVAASVAVVCAVAMTNSAALADSAGAATGIGSIVVPTSPNASASPTIVAAPRATITPAPVATPETVPAPEPEVITPTVTVQPAPAPPATTPPAKTPAVVEEPSASTEAQLIIDAARTGSWEALYAWAAARGWTQDSIQQWVARLESRLAEVQKRSGNERLDTSHPSVDETDPRTPASAGDTSGHDQSASTSGSKRDRSRVSPDRRD